MMLRSKVFGVGMVMSLLMYSGCVGTETGNPFTTSVITSRCKSADDYEGLLMPQVLSAGADQDADISQDGVSLELGEIERIPVWLSCVEWASKDDSLLFQVANFAGGCEIDWQSEVVWAQSDGQPPGLYVNLQNNNCSVAACGNCSYDLRTPEPIEFEPLGDLEVQLIRRDCEGQAGQVTVFSLPLSKKAVGLSCEFADTWAASAAADSGTALNTELYAPCNDALESPSDIGIVTQCADGLSCVDGRCVSSCQQDTDCLLKEAEICVSGTCRLAS